MNLPTLKQLIIRELHQDTSAVSTAVTDDVTLAIIESMRFNRRFPFYFNTGTYRTETKIGEYTVNLPSDFLGVLGGVFYTPTYNLNGTSVTSGSRYQLTQGSVDNIESLRLKGTDYGRETVTGYATMYAIDTNGSPARILLSPVPTSVDTIDFRMIYDLGTPDIDGSGGWSYYERGTLTAWSGESRWFKEAVDLIKYRALYILWSGVYGGSDVADGFAMKNLNKWKEEYSRLCGETSRLRSGGYIGKYI